MLLRERRVNFLYYEVLFPSSRVNKVTDEGGRQIETLNVLQIKKFCDLFKNKGHIVQMRYTNSQESTQLLLMKTSSKIPPLDSIVAEGN